MNIVIVADYMDALTNGTVISTRRFVDGLRARGHRVKLVAFGADGEDSVPLEKRYWPIVSNVAGKQNITFAKFDRARIADAFRGADVVHLIMPVRLERLCKKLADEMGIPATTATHVQPENISYSMKLGWCIPFNSFLYRYLDATYFRHFTHIHCPSRFIADQLIKHGYTAKMHVISNGYDPAFTPPAGTKAREGKFNVIMVARYSGEKNQSLLIRALARSKNKDNIKLSLFGKGPDEAKLRRLADEYLGGGVEFAFLNKEQLIAKLQAGDLYIHTAVAEIEAIAALEAIACGLVPVIANSSRSATPQFALDERSLFRPGDEDDLAQKIDYWAEHEAERAEMSAKYAAFAAENFSLERSVELIERMFTQAIEEHKAKSSGVRIRQADQPRPR